MKEERSKQGRTNNKAKQHSTLKAVTYPKKYEPPRGTHLQYMCISVAVNVYMYMYIHVYMCNRDVPIQVHV